MPSALHHLTPRILALVSPLFIGAALSAQGNVWTVDDDGGLGASLVIQDAIDLASDGDIVVVRPGIYLEPITVDGKSLTIIADPDSIDPFSLEGDVTVRNIGADQQFTLRGLDIHGGTLTFEDCEGAVWLEDLSAYFYLGVAGITIRNCVALSMHRVEQEFYFLGIAAEQPGLLVEGSNVYVFNSEIGAAFGSPTGFGADPGPGADVRDSRLFLYGSRIVGGVGKPGAFGPCTQGGPGGAGLVASSGSVVTYLDTEVLGGLGGPGGFGCGSGPQGPAKVLEPGAVEESLAGAAQSFEVDSPLRESEFGELRVTGASNMSVLWIVSAEQGHSFFSDLAGGLVVNADDFLAVLAGTTDSAGELELVLTAPTLPVGFEFIRFHTQPLFFHPPVGFFLGNGSTIEILDSAF